MSDRRNFLRSAAAGVAAASAGERADAANGKRPNFLFLIADDLTFRGVRALGNAEVRTPVIDGLMNKGCTFTHCFHQGSWSGAVCVASRAMLNSGLTTFRARREMERTPLWAQTFGDAGYDTFLVGKWHLSQEALRRSFQKTGGVAPGMFESGPEAYNRPADGNAWSPWDTSRKGQWLHTKQWRNTDDDSIRHSAAMWADGAVDYLRQAPQRKNPFLLYVGFNSPHDPRQSPKEFVDSYPADAILIPANYAPEHPFDQGDHRLRDEVLAPFPRTHAAVRLHRSEYYAHISYMDTQIGRILEALRQSGEADNTYVILTSDHGLAVGEHGLMGKQNMYDHSVRMPYVIAGPGIPKKKRVDAMVYQHSTFATTCDLAGITTPKAVEFPSLMPLVKGEKAELHDAMFCWYLKYQRSVRTREFKLVVYPEAGVTQLFRLTTDPWETKNLARDPDYAAVQGELLRRLHRFQKELGDDVCPPV